jgi:hypothetical protein
MEKARYARLFPKRLHFCSSSFFFSPTAKKSELHFFRQKAVRAIAIIPAVVVLRNQHFLLSLDDAKTELAVASL